MYLTVRDVLGLPPLGELRLVAGETGLDRQVTQVSVLEVVGGPRQWWRGGELFMSTLYVLRGTGPEMYTQVVHNLNDHAAAALILHPGLEGHRYLGKMEAVADEVGLPLILMPEDMPYAVVTDAVMGGLLGRQAALLERSAAVNRELIQVALRGGDLDDICRAVARRTGQPVAVIGTDGVAVLAHSGKTSDPHRLLPDLLEHRFPCGPDIPANDFPVPRALNIRGPGQVQTTVIRTTHGPVKQIAVAVSTRREICAYLVTWEVRGALSELDFTVLAHACTAVGLEVLKQQAVLEAEHRIQQSFFGAALSGELGSLTEAQQRAANAGVELAPAYLVATLTRGSQLPPAATREIERWRGSTVIPHSNALVLVLPIGSSHSCPLERASRMLERITELISSPHPPVHAGLSRVASGVLELPRALAEARLAVSVAERLDHDSSPQRYDQLGVYQLLAEVADSDILRRFARQALERLLDSRGGEVLVETLEAYLDAGGSPRAAGNALHLHPNTIKYRIENIRRVLGDQALDDPVRRLGLHVALKIRHLEA